MTHFRTGVEIVIGSVASVRKSMMTFVIFFAQVMLYFAGNINNKHHGNTISSSQQSFPPLW